MFENRGNLTPKRVIIKVWWWLHFYCSNNSYRRFTFWPTTFPSTCLPGSWTWKNYVGPSHHSWKIDLFKNRVILFGALLFLTCIFLSVYQSIFLSFYLSVCISESLFSILTNLIMLSKGSRNWKKSSFFSWLRPVAPNPGLVVKRSITNLKKNIKK